VHGDGWLVHDDRSFAFGVAGVLDGLRDLAVSELFLLRWVVAVEGPNVTGQDVKPVALLTVAGARTELLECRLELAEK